MNILDLCKHVLATFAHSELYCKMLFDVICLLAVWSHCVALFMLSYWIQIVLMMKINLSTKPFFIVCWWCSTVCVLQVELLQALRVSLRSLQGERDGLSEQQKRFTALGDSMEALVQERCKPNEREKYRMFVGDLEKIVNLLLSLSARLARVENALDALRDDDAAEERVRSVAGTPQNPCSSFLHLETGLLSLTNTKIIIKLTKNTFIFGHYIFT